MLYKYIPIAILSFICCLSFSVSFSQANTDPCFASPFCSDSAYNFDNNTSGTAPAGPNYGCLSQQPGPAFYYMQIGTAGTMQLSLSQQTYDGLAIDVDFAMWGPYPDLATGCAAVMAGGAANAPIQCSYSPSSSETLGLGIMGGTGAGQTTPPAAQVGEVYIVLINNYASQSLGAASAGTISFAQTGGTGSADCGLVCGLTASNSGNTCIGGNVQLQASTTDTTHSFTYYWTGPNGFNATGATANVTPTGPGTYSYNVMSISEDDDTCNAQTVVTIYPKYNDTINQQICNGQTYTFNGTTVSQTGYYHANLTSVNGCDSLVTLNLIVNPLPNVAISYSSNILCKGGNVIFNVENPSTLANYQWYNEAGQQGTGTQFTATDTGTYFAVGITNSGCLDTSVYVRLQPDTVNVDFNWGLDKSCGGDTVLFTNLSDSGRYWWNFDDNSAVDSVHDNPTHYFTPQGQYDVKLIAQNELGCRDSVTKVVDTRHPIDAVFGLSSDSVCQADNLVYFLDHSTGDLDAWHWDFGDGNMSDEQNPTHSYAEPGTFTVMLVVKELGLPCTDTAYSTVYVDSTPHIILITDNDSVCNGQRVNFSLDYTHTATQILWDFGDGSNHEGTDVATYHSYDNPGQYIVTVTSEHPVCPNVSDMDTILVKPYPIVNLGPDTALCLNGEAYYLSDTINTITPGVKWRWNTGDSTPVLKIVHPGTYTVDADLDGCITSDEIVVRKDCYADIPNSFTPNGDGVNDYFFPRQLLTQGVTGFSMVIFNRWGEKIFETKSIDGRGWDGRLSGKDQPVGVYLYTIDITYKSKAAEHYEGNVSLLR